MRILILTALFVSGFYYFFGDNASKVERSVAQDDAVKMKSAAPARSERLLTAKPAPQEESEEASAEEYVETAEDENLVEEDSAPVEHEAQPTAEDVGWTDLDAAWNGELKEFLGRLEPSDADNIHRNYMTEVEGYKAEVEALLNERQQKASDEATSEVDQLISQLDQKHEDKLKDIFGAHYDAIRDHYSEFMQSNSTSEE